MSASIDRHRVVLRRLALLCALLVLVVTSASALLRQAKAGLACEDRAACYGQELRRLQQGVEPSDETQTTLAAVRLAHRIAASGVLLLGLMMLMIAVSARLRRETVLTVLLLALAAGLAVLGLRSSAARLPAVVLGNLLGGFLMLALCVRLARPAAAAGRRAALQGAAAIAALLLVIQVALGGLTSASFAGLSCSGWGGCDTAEVWRDADGASLNPWREPALNAAAPFNPSGALAHSLHRWAGFALAAVLAGVALLALRRERPRAGMLLLALLVLQLGVGLALAAFALPIGLAIAHNVLAALLLATLVSLA